MTPPDAATEVPRATSRKGPRLVVGLGLLLVFLALLVVLLPLFRSVPGPGPAVAPVTSRLPETETRVAPAKEENAALREQVEQLIGDWYRQQAAAEAGNLSAWGGAAYASAAAQARQCEELHGQQQWPEARDACESALEDLDHLLEEKPALLEQALATGEDALARGDVMVATDQFRHALVIAPEDERAEVGLERAMKLPELLQRLAEGEALEQAGNPDAALLAYRAARDIDPDSLLAQEALSRTLKLISERDFSLAMSRALQAYADGRPAAANRALAEARTLRPQDPAVNDLALRIGQRQLSGELARLRTTMETAEQEERWPEALQACERARTLDPGAAFVAGCASQYGDRVALDQQLEALISEPDQLFTKGPLAEAHRLLDRAKGLSPSGPRLETQIAKLEDAIRIAETEIEVVLRSDGQTEVAIYHVGRLGRFNEKRLVLRTGDYTVTGNRAGYHDVRQTLKVRPGQGPLVFILRCEEPI